VAILTNMSSILWPDSNIQAIHADFDTVEITLVDGSDRNCRVVCRGYISFSIVGLWDETIVGSASVVPVDQAELERLVPTQRRRMASGDPVRNSGSFDRLAIQLIDGATIMCVAAGFEGHLS
jgi:hypothetical protein